MNLLIIKYPWNWFRRRKLYGTNVKYKLGSFVHYENGHLFKIYRIDKLKHAIIYYAVLV